ncbi:hypothetical protein NI17_009925 [Thermobifida halotolerans]|uniref:Uncharacterized protein n=2 Tax=Thermobifida halotolerans TaxID=483545 RepID=A0AA97M023_9ACTN|nr:hypothetical protein [Thermobifida halotolerans]UOE21397.1 hypothetical protein NI17_009925 [Thermobifida halotolerans]
MAVNDADRRYAELTPALDLEWRAQYGRRGVLVVTMTGPVGLERLDRVEVTVADPIPDRAPVIAGGPTQQELDAQVWGPYRFVTSTAHVASHRTAQLDQVRVNIPVHLAMERAPAPHWVADFAGWEEERAGDPVLITLVCHHADHQSWTLHRSVPVR